ncbi:MAG: spermidine/putrescine ABC transporter substrate-binding protein [Clostridia bacterium]|nr:spermidine/putrescine ABC transporter substrate-binding protein [Clostridia bacterium]
MKLTNTKRSARRAAALALLLLLSLTLPLLLSACKGSGEERVTLYVYNWGEYISDGSEGSLDTNQMFEEWYYETYGVRVTVNYSTYSSNESMYAKLSSGSVNYDVIVPSDYMIERMIAEDMLAPLRKENIPHLSNLDEKFFGDNAIYDYYDPDNLYAVPYMYGMIGIIYNTTMVEEDDPALGSWQLMWDERHRGNILQFNNSRDAFGTAQYFLGLDVNSSDEAEWRKALEKLKEQKKVVQGYVMDEIFNKMENGSAAIAAYYAGDFLSMYENNADLEFFYPAEGTNLYVDAMCIPKTSQNRLIAERYIDFMLREEPAVANAEYTYYASPNAAVQENQEYVEYMNSIKEGGYELMYGTDGIKTSSYKNLDADTLFLINTLWEELKSDIDVGLPIYIACGVILAVLIGGGSFLAIRKRIRDNY